MNTDQIDIKQGKKTQGDNQQSPVRRGRWIIKGINYSRGYGKLVHLVTGEKRYVALLNHPSYRDRFSFSLFERAESAVDHRKKVFEQVDRLRSVYKKEE